MRVRPPPAHGCSFRTAALLVGAASMTGCLSSYFDPAPSLQDIGPGAGDDPEHPALPRPPTSRPSSAQPGLLPRFLDRLGQRALNLDRSADLNVLTDDRAKVGPPFASTFAATPASGAFTDELTQADVSERALLELRRLSRRSLRDALSQERIYRQLRQWLPVSVGDDESLGSFPDRALGATVNALPPPSRSVPPPEASMFADLDPGDIDASLSVGVRPEVEISWMSFYSFSWGPRDNKIVHRLEYAMGPVGLEAEYRLREGAAALMGAGIQFALAPLASLSFTAAEELHGAAPDRPWTYLAELNVRF